MRTIDTIQVGDSASFTKTVTETDIILYAGISGDMNPAHINAEAAKEGTYRKDPDSRKRRPLTPGLQDRRRSRIRYPQTMLQTPRLR